MSAGDPARVVVRKPAAVRRQEIIDAAAVEFAAGGLAGTGLETIAAGAGISHPRVVQMFGSKQKLFLEVVESVYGRVAAVFTDVAVRESRSEGGPDLVDLGRAYLRLLQRDRTVALVMLQGYAAAGDDVVRAVVARRYLELQQQVIDMTGADAHRIRSFMATGLVVTISTALALPGKRDDAVWGAWLLELAGTDSLGDHQV
ncbi:TetR/AcrR family transcriptional regulator [Mycobacterium sp. ITM-2016-00316]|uniref:TetR/AcrR family transcriptional regulator n=1 Tax=Mycobacterium sp. ITM-2016-00316 TaxID=2099695 RepID=UPI000CF8E7A1|nr:TetR/AcrR family transcriptional regulator [Mycobacterium sp. ITM-2016-00316]WNG80845.1 TetR/AcrR family transcriptional regulator [Mycobacterium sp. ITM-2016-00316]